MKFGERDYDPRVGRWTTRDPIGVKGGGNLYSFVDGDPVNMIDMKGLTPNTPYGSFSEAYTRALADAYLLTKQYHVEYGGWIFKYTDGMYGYTELVKGDDGSVDAGARPSNAKASFHSHPRSCTFTDYDANYAANKAGMVLMIDPHKGIHAYWYEKVGNKQVSGNCTVGVNCQRRLEDIEPYIDTPSYSPIR